MNSDFVNNDFPKNENILPVPTKQPTASLVPSDYDKNYRNSAIAPSGSQWYKPDTFCNILPPPPRSQMQNYPVDTTNCTTYPESPYKRNKCYMVKSRGQGINGIICGGAGGTGNANFVRGNQFADNYDMQNQLNEYNYTVERPVQVPLENVLLKKNPEIINNNSFYPYPNYRYKNNIKYMTYPNFTDYCHGQPVYRYPYNTITKSPISIEKFGPAGPILNNEKLTYDCVEKFKNGKCTQYSIYIAITILLVIAIIVVARKK